MYTKLHRHLFLKKYYLEHLIVLSLCTIRNISITINTEYNITTFYIIPPKIHVFILTINEEKKVEYPCFLCSFNQITY